MKYYVIGNDHTPIDHLLFHKAWIEDGYAYTSGDEKYGKALRKIKEGDVLFCYCVKIGVVAIGKVMAEWDGVSREDPLYEDRQEQGKVYKIKVNWHSDLTISPIPYKKLSEFGFFSVRQTLQEIKSKETATKILALVESYNDIPYLDDIPEGNEIFYEGEKRRVLVNAYERDREARKKCIDHFGTRCVICGIDFSLCYGPEFEGITHIHHLKKMADVGKKYQVNPLRDLIPVCPNCHTAIHSRKEPYTIEEMKQKIRYNLFHGIVPAT